MNLPSQLLLDTCVVIWLSEATVIDEEASARIEDAKTAGGVYVSPATAWELGHLTRARGLRGPRMRLSPDTLSWFNDFMARPGTKAAPFTAEMALHASFLPGVLHDDPADRLLIATARLLGIPLVTRDENILAYARAGHVQAIPC